MNISIIIWNIVSFILGSITTVVTIRWVLKKHNLFLLNKDEYERLKKNQVIEIGKRV